MGREAGVVVVRIINVASVVLCLGGPAQAGSGVWTTTGPHRGAGEVLVVDPTTPSIVYAGLPGSGLFRSTNAGATWQPLAGPDANVKELAIVPLNHAILYAIASSGLLWKSTDFGDTWTPAGSGLPTVLSVIAVDPTNPTTLYVAGDGVYRSTDAGATWNPVGAGINGRVTALVVDPRNPAVLYAGTVDDPGPRYETAFKSTDGGATWFPASAGMAPGMPIRLLAMDPTISTTLYAAGYYGELFKSTDAGSSWSDISSGLESRFSVYSLAIDPTASSTLYANISTGILKSSDAGATWAAANAGLNSTSISSLALSAASPSTLYVGTDVGVFESTDSGGSWHISSTGLPKAYLKAVFVPLTDTARVYAGMSGFYRSSDSGGTWTSSPPTGPLPLQRITTALAMDPTNAVTLYAGGPYACFPYGPIPRVCYATFHKSTDGGATWRLFPPNTGLPLSTINALVVDPKAPFTLYAGMADGSVNRSNDGGTTWAAPKDLIAPVSCLAIDPLHPATVYAGGSNGVFKSTDAGVTWVLTSAGLPTPSASVAVLVVEPGHPSTIYAGTGADGVYKSTDAGATWAPANVGIPGFVTALAMDPSMPAVLYAGTPGLGVYRTTDAGATWSPVSKGLAAPIVWGLAIDPTTGTVYAATPDGVWQSTPPAGADADLSLTLSDSPDPVTGTTPVTYTLTVTNDGPGPAGPLSVTQTLPAGVVFDSAGGPGWTCTEAQGVVRCKGAGLAVGAAAPPLSVRVTPGPAGAVLTSSAAVSTGEADPDPADNSDSETTTVNQALVWFGTRTKTAVAASGRFVINGELTYTITLANSGTQPQADAVGDELSDTLPSSLALSSASATSGTATVDLPVNTVRWNGAIPAGGSVSIAVHATIGPKVALGATVSNQGNVRYDADGDGVSEASTVTDDPAMTGAKDPTSFVVVSPPLDLSTFMPCRLVDTREVDGAFGGPALEANSERTFRLVDRCGIPPTARAVSVNLTVTEPTTAGHLRLYPAGTPMPNVSSVNYGAGQTRANNMVVSLNGLGELAVFCAQSSGTTHFLLDVNGYFE